jgi:hypothetical protein
VQRLRLLEHRHATGVPLGNTRVSEAHRGGGAMVGWRRDVGATKVGGGGRSNDGR